MLANFPKMKIQAIENEIGSLSEPSKMPCFSFSIPAKRCITGMKLREVENSICSKCYALKGRYAFANVQNALEQRFAGLSNPNWVSLMVEMISKREKSGFFRWHDSGDLQSVNHLASIVEVARQLPAIKFWLPTREFSIVANYLRENTFPENLTVRLSALMFDSPAPSAIAQRLGLVTSGASSGEDFTCPSSKQEGKCQACRACWNKNVVNINYKKH